MLFTIFQLLICLLFFGTVTAIFKSSIWTKVMSLLGGAFLAFQTSSLILGNAFIDYKYYAHLKVDTAADVGAFFWKQNLISLLAFILSTYIIYRLGKMIHQKVKSHLLKAGMILMPILGMSMSGGIVSNLSSLSSLHYAKEQDFEAALTALDYQNYISKDQLNATKGKNIIVIFMESVEAGYLQDNLAHLTPNLRSLSKEMIYYPMTQVEGGDYTIGGIYTYFTGIPMYFKQHGNDVFSNVIDHKITSVPNVLSKAGYEQIYLAGHPEFAGADVMMDKMQIKVKSEKDYDKKYSLETWGLHDKDLFQLAKQELDSLLVSNNPFALYLSTISTHSTDGVIDWRIKKEMPEQKSNLELMVSAIDHHIGDLIQYLKSKDQLDNTAIFIMPDHLLMGKASRVLKDFEDPRELFVLTNLASPLYENGTPILQIDVPNLILSASDVKHNATFLSGIITTDKLKYLQDNRTKLLQLNEASLTRIKLPTTFSSQSASKVPKIALFPDKIQLMSNSWFGDNNGKQSYACFGEECLTIKRGVNIVSKRNRLFNVENFDTYEDKGQVLDLLSYLEDVKSEDKDYYLIVHDSAGELIKEQKEKFQKLGFNKLGNLSNQQAYLGYKSNGFISEKTGRKVVKESFPLEQLSPFRSKETIKLDAKDLTKFIAHAGGIIEGRTYTNSLEALESSYNKGFRLFELDIIKTSDGHFVAAHDWNQWKEQQGRPDIPTLDTFMMLKIHSKYTPMDMKAINNWFRNHRDAILVTDKINEPKEFVRQFVDRSRLMMELFTFEAIKEAKTLDIKDILLSEGIWDQLGNDKIKGMKDRGLQSMAISIRTINGQRALFQEMKEAGLRIYAFHIGNDGLKDEAYMARSGLDYCYGLYADDWQFK